MTTEKSDSPQTPGEADLVKDAMDEAEREEAQEKRERESKYWSGVVAPATPEPGAGATSTPPREEGPLREFSARHLFATIPMVLRDPVEGVGRATRSMNEAQGLPEGGILCIFTALFCAIPLRAVNGLHRDLLAFTKVYFNNLVFTVLALAVLALGLHFYRRMIARVDTARLGEDLYLAGCFGIPIALCSLLGGVAGIFLRSIQIGLLAMGHVIGVCVLYNALIRFGEISARAAVYVLAILAGVTSLAFAYADAANGLF